MAWTFEIEGIYNVSGRTVVVARMLTGEASGKLTDSSTLASIPIENWFDIPRSYDKDGNFRNDQRAFF